MPRPDWHLLQTTYPPYPLHSAADKAAGTVGYACPHYVNKGVVTEGSEVGELGNDVMAWKGRKSEVYSFGIVLLELLTAAQPAYQLPTQAATIRHGAAFICCAVRKLRLPMAACSTASWSARSGTTCAWPCRWPTPRPGTRGSPMLPCLLVPPLSLSRSLLRVQGGRVLGDPHGGSLGLQGMLGSTRVTRENRRVLGCARPLFALNFASLLPPCSFARCLRRSSLGTSPRASQRSGSAARITRRTSRQLCGKGLFLWDPPPCKRSAGRFFGRS